MTPGTFPAFRPHPLLPNGHFQTLSGPYAPGLKFPYSAVRHEVVLSDSDTLVLHDDQPEDWPHDGPVVLLMHGLAGCHQSPYMFRIAGKLNQVGVRTFRMDHRGCGAGAQLAALPYHAGRSDDALAALQFIHDKCPNSPLSIVGFSLSGNITLKLLGEDPGKLPDNLCSAVAVNPPIDLLACVQRLNRSVNRLYDRHFVNLLWRQVQQRRTIFPALEFDYDRKPRTLYEFDDVYTAPVSGFESALDYYQRCSAIQFVKDIQIPTFVLTSRDDPLIPVEIFDGLNHSPSVDIRIADHGGHLGYIGRRGTDPDRRWMDWRIIEWLTRK